MTRTEVTSTTTTTQRTTATSTPKFVDADAAVGVPTDVPSILELKRILPKHCFQPNLASSFYYVFKDFLIITVLYLAVLCLDALSVSVPYVRYIGYPIYWYIQGTMFWALFVLGHDCGHGSFSSYPLLNDIMGNILHTLILVPYYPWKMSHHHHHKNTGNIDKDEIFYPVRQTEGEQNGKSKHFLPLFGLGLAWFMYLVVGYSPRRACHVNPYDKLFFRHALRCLLSLLMCAGWLGLLFTCYSMKLCSFPDLMCHYFVPVFVFATWLVVTTFLHHQDENVPWYADEKWDFVRGNLSSVDRDYGWAHNLVHNIGTHQIHHLFIKIPHYHLEEATSVFRKTYPHLVRYSDEPIVKAFLKMFFIFDSQLWISDDTKIHVFKDNNKMAAVANGNGKHD